MPLLVVTLIFVRRQSYFLDVNGWMLAAPLIASFAYFSYRPLSHNLLAIFPLLFFTLLGLRKQIEAQEKKESVKDISKNFLTDHSLCNHLVVIFFVFIVRRFYFKFQKDKGLHSVWKAFCECFWADYPIPFLPLIIRRKPAGKTKKVIRIWCLVSRAQWFKNQTSGVIHCSGDFFKCPH